MPTVTVTPDLLKQHLSRAGKIGGTRASHKDKVRAGHAAAAKMFRRLANKAVRAGLTEQATTLTKRAEKQERLAK
jgi:hypothetical protein